MIVQYENSQRKHPIAPWQTLLNTVLPAALAGQPFAGELAAQHSDALVTVTFVGPRQMRTINRDTRGIDRTTDVLSFPMLELHNGRLSRRLAVADYEDPASDPPLVVLGDILVNLEQAIVQAEQYGHSLEREVAFLAVHGLLHLLGYDHETPAEEKRMQKLQRDVLNGLGIER